MNNKNTGDGELHQIILRALMTAPNNMLEKIINDKSLTVFEVQQYNYLVSAAKKYAAQEANKAQQQLLQELMEQLPSSEVDLIKFERDKTGWIEEVDVDPETLTDKDTIAVWQLARHFKQQAIEEVTSVIQNKLEGLS